MKQLTQQNIYKTMKEKLEIIAKNVEAVTGYIAAIQEDLKNPDNVKAVINVLEDIKVINNDTLDRVKFLQSVINSNSINITLQK